MITENKLQSIIDKLKKTNGLLSVNPFSPDGKNGNSGFYIPIDMFHFKVGDNAEFIFFELEILNDGTCRTMRCEFCDNNDMAGYDVFYLPPHKINIIELLKSVEARNNKNESILIDLNALRKTEEALSKTVDFILTELKSA